MHPIQTPRLLVRRYTPDDLAGFLDYQGRPEVIRFSSGPMSAEAAAEYLASQNTAGDGSMGAWHGFAVEHLADGKLIGEVGFWVDNGPEEKADLGFQLHPDYHGRGYAFEAASALLEHAFTRLSFRRITAGCSARNLASLKLIERLGMRREGYFIQSKTIHGELHDEIHHALLRSEWLARQP